MVTSLTEYEASYISQETYIDDLTEIDIDFGNIVETWKPIQTIEDKDTGLHGYVLQKQDTDDIVISFRGTELNNGFKEGYKDIKEDVQGIVLGNSDYTKDSYGKTPYRGTPGQEATINSGKATINQDGTVSYTNKNQFTEANKQVSAYVEEYGKENITFTGHSLGGGLAQYFAVKYDTSAVTFATADIYDLLTKEEQEQVKAGEFKAQIISYIDPEDLVSTYYTHSVGSTYYINNPMDADTLGFDSHGIVNYLDTDMYNENGYFKSEVLYDETLRARLSFAVNKSPLELKNSGHKNHLIYIQTELTRYYARGLHISEEVLKIRRRALGEFLNTHHNEMAELKNLYMNSTGPGNYDQLTPSDVEEIFRELVPMEKGIPMLVNMDEMDEISQLLQTLQEDTGEIAFNMEKMADDFENTDEILAGWLGLKG